MLTIKNKFKSEYGQAMTEFLVSASFVLVPLFLGVSLLAKYIDIKQTAIQAARYQVWEYTVWYAGNSELRSGFDATEDIDGVGTITHVQPVKSLTETHQETRQRFFTNPGTELTTLPITDTDADSDWTNATRNPLWTDHQGNLLYSGVDGAASRLQNSEDTPTVPVLGDIVQVISDGIGFIFEIFGDLMGLTGSSVGFDAINNDAYAESTISMEVAVNPSFVASYDNIKGAAGTSDELTGGTIDFNVSAAVLSDAWNAGGKSHTYNQVGGTAPVTMLASLLDLIPGISDIWNAVTIFAPELRLCNPGGIYQSSDKGSLWLGHIDIDAIHPDRLIDPATGDTLGAHSCNDAGICDFDVIRSLAERECYGP